MEFRCPNCNAPIYSRKNKICGVCEKPLPKELLMSDAANRILKNEMDKKKNKPKNLANN